MRIHDLVNGVQTAPELFINAAVAQAVRSGKLPYILSYAPIASMNPFQRLLYCRAEKSGYVIVPSLRFNDLGKVSWKGRSVIHLHWLASVLSEIKNPEEALGEIEKFQGLLEEWKARGHRILWTMHNVLPHACQYPDYEIMLRKCIIKYADAIHILSKTSVQAASRFFDLPEGKTFHVPHPSYEGWYPNISDSVTAKLDLGLSSAEFVFLQFGSLQRYKGTTELIRAFQKLENFVPDRRLRLVIAGKPTDKRYLAEIRTITDESLNITVIPNAMEDRDLQTLFNASDVVVAPYTDTLNSGTALLAATFGRPFVAPNIGAISDTYIQDHSLLYSACDPDGLVSALLRSLTYSTNRSQLKNIMMDHRPEKISTTFFKLTSKYLFDK